MSDEIETRVKKWRCLICDLVFVTPPSLEIHFRDTHGFDLTTLKQCAWESGEKTGIDIHEFATPLGQSVLWLEWHRTTTTDGTTSD